MRSLLFTFARLALLALVIAGSALVYGHDMKKYALELMALRKIKENQRLSGVGQDQVIPIPMYIPTQGRPIAVPAVSMPVKVPHFQNNAAA